MPHCRVGSWPSPKSEKKKQRSPKSDQNAPSLDLAPYAITPKGTPCPHTPRAQPEGNLGSSPRTQIPRRQPRDKPNRRPHGWANLTGTPGTPPEKPHPAEERETAPCAAPPNGPHDNFKPEWPRMTGIPAPVDPTKQMTPRTNTVQKGGPTTSEVDNPCYISHIAVSPWPQHHQTHWTRGTSSAPSASKSTHTSCTARNPN